MDHDHFQELGGSIAEHGGDADLAAGFELVALYSGDGSEPILDTQYLRLSGLIELNTPTTCKQLRTPKI